MIIDELLTSEEDLMREASARNNPAPKDTTPPPPPPAPKGPTMPRKQQGNQHQYEGVVLAGQKLMYSPEGRTKVFEMLQAGREDPARAIAQTALTIMMLVFEKGRGKITQDVLVAAIGEILVLVAEFAAKAKVFPVEQATVQKAAQIAAAMLKGSMKEPPPTTPTGMPGGAPQGAEMQHGGQPMPPGPQPSGIIDGM